MSYLELLKLASPEATVVLTALVVLAIGLTSAKAAKISSFVAVIGLAVAIGAVLMLPGKATLFSSMLMITPLTSLFKIILLILAAITILLAPPTLPHRSEFLAILLLATIGLMLLVGSEELLMIFIGLELTGLSLYVMTAFDKSDQRSAEAGLKYFLFGSTASAFTLFGLSLIYGMAGTTGLAAIAEKLSGAPAPPLLAAGVVMTLVGFGFKIAAAPFHLWAPDTYQGAPIASAAFIASASKVGSFVVLGKILLVGFAPLAGRAEWHGAIAGWTPIVAALAAASIVLGNLVALAQTNVRRLLAYSAIAHGGYTLLGLVSTGRDGFSATLFYTTIYALTLLGAFGVVGFVRRETGGDDLRHFAGLSARSPLLAGCMAIFMLSLAGLPPLVGFFGKFYLFSAAARAGGNYGLVWLVALALFGSLISLYYYLTILKAIFAQAPMSDVTVGRRDFVSQFTVAALAFAVLFLGILPETLVRLINRSLL
ncbi:MAG: NADH-quinone oxidoreductase subunit N [Verrucomicrobiota bacterium]|nr:NADH-quinone oxidoreductase subunit N [Verrucomicrobiota bacterium]